MAVMATSTASDIQMDYMKLLVTQLQNQNPLEPLMNTNFSDVLGDIKRTYASSLIGKEVSFVGSDESGLSGITSGVVEEVFTNIDGKIVLSAGEYSIGLDDIISVKN